MRIKKVDVDLDSVDADGVCTAQTATGAGSLTIDGALTSGGVATMDYARQIGIGSSNNDSGVTFTLTGTDNDDKALSEAVTGPNAGTAESTGYFKTITGVSVDGATVSDVQLGTVDEVVSQTIPVDRASSNMATVGVDITGTINYSGEYTLDDVQDTLTGSQNAQWFALSALASKTADAIGSMPLGVTAVRLKVNSHSAGAEAQMWVSHVGNSH